MNIIENLFKGRLNRRNYLLRFIVQWIIYYILIIIFENASFILLILFLFMGFSLGTKRLHDLGYSGWFNLLIIIPFIGLFLLIYLFLAPGQKTENKYGLATAGSINFRKTLFGVK